MEHLKHYVPSMSLPIVKYITLTSKHYLSIKLLGNCIKNKLLVVQSLYIFLSKVRSYFQLFEKFSSLQSESILSYKNLIRTHEG